MSRLSKDEVEVWKTFTWERPDRIFEGDTFLFQGGITPDDIKQGCLGNCYFLSALSALAEFPELVKKIFITKKKNAAGCYVVNLCLGGEFYKIIVDDYFPYYPKK